MSVFCDWQANSGNIKGQLVMVSFRIAHGIRSLSAPFWWLGIPYLAWYELTVVWTLGIELRYKTKIGPGLRLYHGQALVVHEGTRIGANCTLRQSTTIGAKALVDGTMSECPVIGDNVDIGSNVVIIGEIKVGDGSVVGAGSVVVKDVQIGVVVAGNPARILRGNGQLA